MTQVERYLVAAWKAIALDLARAEEGLREHIKIQKMDTYRQASQAVFCLRGGGRVLASSWI